MCIAVKSGKIAAIIRDADRYYGLLATICALPDADITVI
ncbi:hypothetical protein BN1221_01008c [Brenneria goodwinii]|uniref:Uncharacterized protein n=1 Tax=Brenneria goodwinii TaxID=1109412 RepID=A0A0G4JRT2_9GAMM|nr:hypothetical protein BN1221_01008c [Brenneria goodwinii]